MICLSKIQEQFRLEEAGSLAFSDNGNLGVASGKCGYIFDLSGKLLNKVCDNWGKMNDVSYSNGKFGFVSESGNVYITDESGNLIKTIRVGSDYNRKIVLSPKGFLVCDYGCVSFDYNGKDFWIKDYLSVAEGNLSYYKNYWIIPTSAEFFKKVMINSYRYYDVYRLMDFYPDDPRSTAVCGDYLAVATNHRLHLFKFERDESLLSWYLKKIWTIDNLDFPTHVVFSPKCKYIAVTDWGEKRLKIFDIKGRQVLEKKYNIEIASIAWWEDRIAISFKKEGIRMYKVKQVSITFSISLNV